MTALEKLAEGREAELFLLPDGRVLRLMRAELPNADRIAELEFAAMRAAAAAGAPVPEVYERVERDGRHGVVMERIEGHDLLSLVGRRPWRVGSVARRCGQLHAELHQVTGPAELTATADRVRDLIEASDAVPPELHEEARAALGELPGGDRLCHGDFHPGNVMGEHVIDWANATRGDSVADVARTWVVLEFSPLPPGSSATSRRLAAAGRGLLLRGYMRSYTRSARLDPALFSRWVRVRAIERLTQKIEGERDRILGHLMSER
ncbi:MAG: phosphotransferase family protein [Thermoleophilaceae bacterium]